MGKSARLPASAIAGCERLVPGNLSEAAYLDRSYLAGIERGLRNPSVRSLLKIANALKVQVRDPFAGG